MRETKVIYYEDEHNDEFSTAKITPRRIDESYVYDRDTPLGRLAQFFWFRVVATPLAFLYTKLAFHHTVKGKEKLKGVTHTGCFLYGNHTQDIADAVIPGLLDPRRRVWVIVHANNVSMPYLGRITPYLGAIPLPDDKKAYRSFIRLIEKRLAEKKKIAIYPEAHIWPYYTGIRPFTADSFSYPIKYRVPVFCFTNTYQKRRCSKKPRMVTYIDGPFFPDLTLPREEQKRELRDRVHATMCERARLSTVEVIRYVRKEETHG